MTEIGLVSTIICKDLGMRLSRQLFELLEVAALYANQGENATHIDHPKSLILTETVIVRA